MVLGERMMSVLRIFKLRALDKRLLEKAKVGSMCVIRSLYSLMESNRTRAGGIGKPRLRSPAYAYAPALSSGSGTGLNPPASWETHGHVSIDRDTSRRLLILMAIRPSCFDSLSNTGLAPSLSVYLQCSRRPSGGGQSRAFPSILQRKKVPHRPFHSLPSQL